MIKIICIGKLKEYYLKEGINDYLNRINKYHKLELIELPDSNILNEKDLILKKINPKDYLITLDIEGKNISSVELANKLDKIFITNPNITFIIGGSEGLHQEIKNLSNYSLSFSKMTFPHGLFRLILLEQIYRSFKILNNESYHK
ncbi:MAG: 23S rRNA (pseudouridine(1915)-N(3))-methyltransferase RlmH [Bacilli bacterium]|nr:23S rRNA (pseudouridine(1915)-N(3))-methyltransferase RlmH [Bacilli bacterium]